MNNDKANCYRNFATAVALEKGQFWILPKNLWRDAATVVTRLQVCDAPYQAKALLREWMFTCLELIEAEKEKEKNLKEAQQNEEEEVTLDSKLAVQAGVQHCVIEEEELDVEPCVKEDETISVVTSRKQRRKNDKTRSNYNITFS